MPEERSSVEVVYALPDKQELAVKLTEGHRPAGHRVLGILQVPEIDTAKNKLGVFAKLTKPDSMLRDRDPVEIYRPLIADPKVRKQRAAEGKGD